MNPLYTFFIRRRRSGGGVIGGDGTETRASSLATWGGAFPAAGSNFTFADGTRLLWDIEQDDADALGLLNFTTGARLRFDDALNTRIVCDGLMAEGGKIYAGTSSTPYQSRLQIDLCGNRPTVSGNPGGGALVTGPSHNGNTATGNNGTTNDYHGVYRGFINDMGGEIKLYGKPGTLARRLNAHYASGTTLTLDAPITAKAGAKVLISPSGFFNASRRTEVRTLAADVNNSATITINSALGYARWGLLQYATDSGIVTTPGGAWTLKTTGNQTGMRTSADLVPDVDNVIDERAFVLIMARDIKVRPYDRPGRPADLANYGFGVHGMTMDLLSRTVLSHVEFEDYGQLALQGRYGWHFHRPSYHPTNTGDGAWMRTGVYGSNGPTTGGGPNYPAGAARVVGCTFTNGHNRGLTLHACRGVELEDNIIHDSVGHGLFEEDQAEEDNAVLRNVAIAPRAPADGQQLKQHDLQAAGFWFANLNNHHEGNWAVDCPFDGVWNSIGPGLYDSENDARGAYFTNPTTASGCIGSSTNVPIWALWAKKGLWKNNAGFCCARFGVRTEGMTNKQDGTIVQAQFQPRFTVDGKPTYADYYDPSYPQDIPALPLELIGITAYKCREGGYFNFVNTPGYKFARMADNFKQCFAGSTSRGSNSNPLLIRESQNHENHALDAEPQTALASYHGLIDHRDVMAWNYSGGDIRQIVGSTFKSADGLLTRNSVLNTYDHYNEGLEMYSMGSGKWALFNSMGMFHTPGPNIMNDLTVYNAYYPGGPQQWNEATGFPLGENPSLFTPPNRSGRAQVYDHFGNFSTGPTQAGVPQGHIVYNIPFFTLGTASPAPLEGNSESVVTTTPFFNLEPRSDDNVMSNGGGHWGGRAEFTRLDTSGNPIAGATYNFRAAQIGDSTTGGGARFAAAPVGSIVHCRLSKDVNDTCIIVIVDKVSYLNNDLYATATDSVIYRFDWSGSFPARVFCSLSLKNGEADYNADWADGAEPIAKEYSNVGVTSLATLRAKTSGWWFWQDTANNHVYVHVRPHQHTISGYYLPGPYVSSTTSTAEATGGRTNAYGMRGVPFLVIRRTT